MFRLVSYSVELLRGGIMSKTVEDHTTSNVDDATSSVTKTYSIADDPDLKTSRELLECMDVDGWTGADFWFICFSELNGNDRKTRRPCKDQVNAPIKWGLNTLIDYFVRWFWVRITRVRGRGF